MAGTEIYYFSGTGNSLAVARMLAERLDGELIPIASVIERERIETDADVIGITFPVYYADLPNIIRRFGEKLAISDGVYIFAIATYGGAVSASLKSLDRIVGLRGLALTAGFGVHMPQNSFHKPWENKDRIYRQAEKRVNVIARAVEARKKGIHYANAPIQWVLTPLEGVFKRITIPYMEKASCKPSPSGLTVEGLIPLADRGFTVNDACSGCGVCAKVCPVNNIEIVDGRPVWNHRCENCLACFNWCPTNAIGGGIASNSYRYRHPDVILQNIADQSESLI